VQDAHYCRAQAQLYFELARHMSVARDAEYCRVTAERHLSEAVHLENHSQSTPATKTRARNPGSREH
jgi:hypothetical protein